TESPSHVRRSCPLYCSPAPPALHSFPTRRSSDLRERGVAPAARVVPASSPASLVVLDIPQTPPVPRDHSVTKRGRAYVVADQNTSPPLSQRPRERPVRSPAPAPGTGW